MCFTSGFVRTTVLACALGVSVAGFAGPTLAQTAGGQSASRVKGRPETVQKLKAKLTEIQQLTKQLRRIEQKAAEANPDLRKQQSKFVELVMDTMKDGNFDPKVELERMRRLQAELRSGQLNQKDRQAKLEELRQRRQRFISKQNKAMRHKAVQDAGAALSRKLKAAMTKQDPKAGDMMARLRQLRVEYRDLLRKAIAQQQGNS